MIFLTITPTSEDAVELKIRIEDLEPGEHICVPRLNGMYYHHGIYAGDNKVLHVTGDRGASCLSSIALCDSEIKVESMDTFIYYNDMSYCVVSKPSKKFTQEELEKFVGKHEYNLLENNCEHFCTSVNSGKRESIQIEHLKKASKFSTWCGVVSSSVAKTISLMYPMVTLPILAGTFFFTTIGGFGYAYSRK